MELLIVRWEPFEGLNTIQSRINDLFADGRTRAYPTNLPPLEFGILLWTF